MKKVFLFLFPLFSSQLSAQVQQPTILLIQGVGGNANDQIPVRTIQSPEGGFIVTIGTKSSSGNLNVSCTSSAARGIFNKYSADGATLEWQKCREDSQDSSYAYLFPTLNGSFVLGGASFSITSQDFMIKKEDANSATLWTKVYGGSGGELLRDMAATNDGGYIMLGVSNSNDGDVGFHYGGQFNEDIWALKLDSSGNKVWSTIIGGTGDENVHCVVPTQNGGCYIVGYTQSSDHDCISNHGLNDVLVVRLDSAGNKVWTKCFGGTASDGIQKGWAVDNGKGGIVFATTTRSSDGNVTSHIGAADFWVVNIDSTGVILWDKCYGSTGYESASSICIADDHTIWVAGESGAQGGQVDTGYGLTDAWIIHTDSVGNLLSAKVLGASDLDQATVLHPLAGGAVMVGGVYYAPGPVGGEFPSTGFGNTDVFLARLAPWTTDIVDPMLSEIHMDIYPNPATTTLTVKPRDSRTDYSITMISISGSRVYSKINLIGQTTIDVSAFTSGVYYLQTTSKSGKKFSKSVLIN